MAGWIRRNLLYWEALASTYNHLYSTAWSRSEDESTRSILQAEYAAGEGTRVLDIGCGDGLAYRLLGSGTASLQYTGIDLSTKMIAALKRRHPEVSAIQGSAEEVLARLPAQSFDLIVSINSAASFPKETKDMLILVGRLLAPKGRFCLAFLNRHSLRRFVRGERQDTETYRTRGDRLSSEGVPAHTMTTAQFDDLIQASSLERDSVHYQSILGGVWENQRALPVERVLSRLIPRFGHSIIFCGTRRGRG
jgi:SAM-dependent methyltransferase